MLVSMATLAMLLKFVNYNLYFWMCLFFSTFKAESSSTSKPSQEEGIKVLKQVRLVLFNQSRLVAYVEPMFAK